MDRVKFKNKNRRIEMSRAPLAEDEKLLLTLYTSLKRATAPLQLVNSSTSIAEMSLSPGILHLLGLVVLDNKSHDETLFLTQGRPARPTSTPPSLPGDDVKSLAKRLRGELDVAMHIDTPLGECAHAISEAASHLRNVLMSRGVDLPNEIAAQVADLDNTPVSFNAPTDLPPAKTMEARSRNPVLNHAQQRVVKSEERKRGCATQERKKSLEPLSSPEFHVVAGILIALYTLISQGPLHVLLLVVAYFVMTRVFKVLLKLIA